MHERPREFDSALTASYSQLVGYCRQLSYTKAEDIAHSAVVRALASYKQFDPSKGKLATWLCTIARNISVDDHRASTRVWNLEIPTSTEPAQEHAARLRQVCTRVGTMSALQQKVCEPKILGYTDSEIAKMCRLPLGSIKSAQREVRAELLAHGY